MLLALKFIASEIKLLAYYIHACAVAVTYYAVSAFGFYERCSPLVFYGPLHDENPSLARVVNMMSFSAVAYGFRYDKALEQLEERNREKELEYDKGMIKASG